MTEPGMTNSPFEADHFTVQPSTINLDESQSIPSMPLPEWGPDHTKSADGPTDGKTTRQRNKKSPFSSLGQNKKVRSGVRALTEKDRDKIVSLYTMTGMALMPFKPKTAQAFALVADDAAKAWYDLARENDSVRRTILMLIEGGAWGALFAAHLPILLTLLPESAMSNLPFQFDPNDMLRNMDDGNDDK